MMADLSYEVNLRSYTLKEPLMQVLESIWKMRPDVVCFSAYIWNRLMICELITELVKLLPSVIVVVGGPEAHNIPEQQNCILIHNEGEAAFRQLAENGFNRVASIPDKMYLSDIPFPYIPEDVNELEDHLVYYETYRGCPYGCVYCLSAKDNRTEYRFDIHKDADQTRLYRELDALCALKPRTVKFIDRSFNIQKDLAHRIWKYVIGLECDFDFHFEIYPDLLDFEDIALLQQAPADRIRFEIGIQTTNAEVSAISGRRSNWGLAKKMLTALKQSTKVRIHADLLGGLPGEDLSSVLNSLNELCICEPDAVQLGLLKILPDTPMLTIAQERGYIWQDTPPYQVLATDALSFDDICLLDDYAHILSLYWNKEEYKDVWHKALQKVTATEAVQHLKDIHTKGNLALHSVSKGKRELVMQEFCRDYHLY
jgi:radical SAM superfamily enzyme YgiQ (UPF0313 family)